MNALTQYADVAGQKNTAEALIRSHGDLVRRIAYHLCAKLPPSVEVDDLIQAGMIGLLEAANQFKTGRGATFETYAGIRIRGAMLDSLRRLDWTPRSVHRRAREVSDAIRDIESTTGAEAPPAAIAAKLGVSIDEYHQIVQDSTMSYVSSLEDIEGADPADEQVDPLRALVDSGFRVALATAIEGLPEREKLVMSLYYQDELNLKEIGLVLGVTESRVSQLHGQALARLKARLADWRSGGDGVNDISLRFGD
jgi:RNA polymerase sigma factor for flagellar operon FliA